MGEPILAGDVGGTKTELRFIDDGGALLHRARYVSADAPDLSTHVRAFFRELAAKSLPKPRVAAFGIAGPVSDNVCVATNLPWRIEGAAMASELGLSAVRLLNDFEATAYGVLHVPATSLLTLQEGRRAPHGNIAVIGAGTGLGEAIVTWVAQSAAGGADGRWHVVSSEGGHADFAATNDDEVELLRYLQKQFGHVSWERIVSGLGIANVYAFLRARGDAGSAAVEAEVDAAGSHGAGGVVGKHAVAGDDPRSQTAIALFLRAYGAEAGNHALKCIATGGVYLTGGIAPKLRSLLPSSEFLPSFRAKGRLSPIVENAPVHVVLDEDVPVLGAAAVARLLA